VARSGKEAEICLTYRTPGRGATSKAASTHQSPTIRNRPTGSTKLSTKLSTKSSPKSRVIGDEGSSRAR